MEKRKSVHEICVSKLFMEVRASGVSGAFDIIKLGRAAFLIAVWSIKIIILDEGCIKTLPVST